MNDVDQWERETRLRIANLNAAERATMLMDLAEMVVEQQSSDAGTPPNLVGELYYVSRPGVSLLVGSKLMARIVNVAHLSIARQSKTVMGKDFVTAMTLEIDGTKTP